jgi:hypothetical protein
LILLEIKDSTPQFVSCLISKIVEDSEQNKTKDEVQDNNLKFLLLDKPIESVLYQPRMTTLKDKINYEEVLKT